MWKAEGGAIVYLARREVMLSRPQLLVLSPPWTFLQPPQPLLSYETIRDQKEWVVVLHAPHTSLNTHQNRVLVLFTTWYVVGWRYILWCDTHRKINRFKLGTQHPTRWKQSTQHTLSSLRDTYLGLGGEGMRGFVDMLSTPAAIPTEYCPALIAFATSATACNPELHALSIYLKIICNSRMNLNEFTFRVGTLSGNPAILQYKSQILQDLIEELTGQRRVIDKSPRPLCLQRCLRLSQGAFYVAALGERWKTTHPYLNTVLQFGKNSI